MVDNVVEAMYYHSMDPLTSLEDAVAALRGAWADGGEAVGATDLDRSRLIAVTDALGMVTRLLGGLRSQVAVEVARESRPEMGSDALAREHGYRNAVALIASITGSSTAEASRLVEVGRATATGTTLTGEPLPAKHPSVATAVGDGRLSVDAALAISRMLDRVALRATPEALLRAEQTLVSMRTG